MVKMNEMTDKDFEARGSYLDEGVHTVLLQKFTRGKTPNTGSEYIDIELLGENDEQGSTRLYLTEKTMDRSRSILAAIAVHNKEDEKAKEKVRAAFKAIVDTDQLSEDFLKNLVEMQAWALVQEDKTAPKPNGGFYLRTNLYSYEPKPRKETADDIMAAGEAISVDPNEVPFA